MRFLPCKKEDIKERKSKRIAIIGAGPAGLTAAGHLICEGYQVDVYEKLPEPGGLLLFGIPDFRFNKKRIREGIKQLEDAGVKFICNMEVGVDIPFETILNKYDAVIIATGAWEGIELNIPGKELDGIYKAIDFLSRLDLYKAGHIGEDQLLKWGEKVLVVGCGESAMDASRTAIRLGCKEVTVVYRRTMEYAPAHKREIEIAQREGVKFIWLASPIRYIGDENGRVKEVECIRMELGEPDSSGRPKPKPIPGSEFKIEADTVILAIGQRPTPPFKDGQYGIKLNPNGTIWTDEYGRTTRKGVFAIGDIQTGPKLVGTAIASAKKAVEAVIQWLEEGKWFDEEKNIK